MVSLSVIPQTAAFAQVGFGRSSWQHKETYRFRVATQEIRSGRPDYHYFDSPKAIFSETNCDVVLTQLASRNPAAAPLTPSSAASGNPIVIDSIAVIRCPLNAKRGFPKALRIAADSIPTYSKK